MADNLQKDLRGWAEIDRIAAPMSLSPTTAPTTARIIPIRPHGEDQWHGDLQRFLRANPRHLEWLIGRPVIRHFVEEVLLAEMVHARAEEIVLHHGPGFFEIDFCLEGACHRIDIPHQRWALPVMLRLKQMAGMDITDAGHWQEGELALPSGGTASVRAYPLARRERLVLRARFHGLECPPVRDVPSRLDLKPPNGDCQTWSLG